VKFENSISECYALFSQASVQLTSDNRTVDTT